MGEMLQSILLLLSLAVVSIIGQEERSLRLIGGSTLYEGRLEIYMNGEWGTICDDYFDDVDASVACRQLGYTRGIARRYAYYGEGTGSILMNNIQCTGTELALYDCPHITSHNCGHSQDAGVTCSPGVRLVGGSNSYEGRLEVYINGAWGTVCDDYFDDTDASVACRQLGLLHGTARGSAYYGTGSGSILMNDVSCTGSESSITSCTYTSNHDCGHWEDVGVTCATPIRVVGGTRNWLLFSGRVEVYVNGAWGTVCDNGWDDTDAGVVCSQLGYESGGVALHQNVLDQNVPLLVVLILVTTTVLILMMLESFVHFHSVLYEGGSSFL